MKKIVTVLLSALFCAFSFLFTACAEEIAPNGSFGGSAGESTDSSQILPQGEAFTVKLYTTDGGELPSLLGIRAIWTSTEGGDIYQAEFDETGKATCYGPDGEYRITLSKTPSGYTYNPNIYFADNQTTDRTIDLYPLRSLTGGAGNRPPDHAQVRTTGAYRFTFDTPDSEIFFVFGAHYSGKMCFESLLDVTANEISPIFYKLNVNHIAYNENSKRTEIIGGGASNTYTKNFKFEGELSDSQDMLFIIGVDTVNPNAFPVSIDVLIQKTGEYTDTDSIYEDPGLDIENIPVADLPSGTFTSIADYNNQLTGAKSFDERMVVEKDGKYYYNANYNQKDEFGVDLTPVADESKQLYVVLTRDVMGIFETYDRQGGHANKGITYFEIRQRLGKYDYTAFIAAYEAKVNSDGSYPVNNDLKQYLVDFNNHKQMFYDGHGSVESMGTGYTAYKESGWLFVCGFYL